MESTLTLYDVHGYFEHSWLLGITMAITLVVAVIRDKSLLPLGSTRAIFQTSAGTVTPDFRMEKVPLALVPPAPCGPAIR